MPPKKKAAAVIIDGVDTSQMTREQLEVFALRVKEELEREREERNYFQLERDKLKTFWQISKNELEEARAKLRNKDREMEILTEKNEEEIKNFRQKIKHLQYEHENNIAELRAESMMALRKAQDDHHEQENYLLSDKKQLKKQLRTQESDNNEQIQALQLQQSEEIYNARKRFEDLAKETEMKYEKMYEVLRNELHTKHSMEMSEVEERKNSQIAKLVEDHKKEFSDVKNYYNDITLNNLALINTMKEQMQEMQKLNARMAKQVNDLTIENKKLVEPFKAAQTELRTLTLKLQNYDKDKIAFQNTTIKLNETKKLYEDLKWANSTLELRFEKIEAERNELNTKFVEGILTVQQKTCLKNMLLQQKIEALTEQLEIKDATLGELIAATQLQPQAVNKKLEVLLKKKNTAIKDLQYELARVAKAHDDLLQTYEAKLQTYGIPLGDLGFLPLKMIPEKQSGMAKGPAGLVTKNK